MSQLEKQEPIRVEVRRVEWVLREPLLAMSPEPCDWSDSFEASSRAFAESAKRLSDKVDRDIRDAMCRLSVLH